MEIQLGPLEFCEAAHSLLTSLESDVKIGFMDDVTLSGDLLTVEEDVIAIKDVAVGSCLQLNQAKCEIIMDDFSLISTSPVFKQFIRVEKEDMMLLEAQDQDHMCQDSRPNQKNLVLRPRPRVQDSTSLHRKSRMLFLKASAT